MGLLCKALSISAPAQDWVDHPEEGCFKAHAVCALKQNRKYLHFSHLIVVLESKQTIHRQGRVHKKGVRLLENQASCF